MIPEFLSQVFALNVNWLVHFFLINLFWVFAFAACIYLFFEGKHFWAGLILIIIDIWCWMDVTTILGWQLLVGGLLTVYYVSKIAIVTFAHYDVNLTKHLPLITIVHGVLVIILYNLFAA